MKLCIHSSMTTGITTVAEHHVGRAISNLDDGNQIMWQLLEDNLLENQILYRPRGDSHSLEIPGLEYNSIAILSPEETNGSTAQSKNELLKTSMRLVTVGSNRSFAARCTNDH